MLQFLGNCQADFLHRAMTARGYDCRYRVLASPLTYPSHDGSIPDSLARLCAQYDLEEYMLGRTLEHQFRPVPDDGPELLVINLFHENTPLFIHDDEGYIFFMDTTALTDKPEVMAWAQDNCRMFQPNPAAYLKRFEAMLVRLRQDNPGLPMLVLTRLGHRPAFGPDPYSYLEGWNDLWSAASETVAGWTNTIEDLHVIDMERIFGGIWSTTGLPMETLCPFLKISLEETGGEITGLHARRDLEHISPMPDALADTVVNFLETGRVEYAAHETIPPQWQRSWRAAPLDEAGHLERLNSGSNFQGAEAVASFFLDLGRDRTDLLVQAAEQMPICHMTLHMIKEYGRIWKNPALASWCDTQQIKLAAFTDNGPHYQQQYQDRLDTMRANALS